MRFDTFNEVKKWYDETKPIISRNHTALDDIRPLHNRRYKWERIVKLSDNKYAIVDGSWSPLTYNTSTESDRSFNLEVIEKMGAILWEKRVDGEYIHIRGCANGNYSISRYKLLDMNLPWSLRHVSNTRQGHHWIRDTVGNKEYKLPKMLAKMKWNQNAIEKYEDNSLVFKRVEDEHGRTVAWERVGEVTITGTTLDLDRKKQLKPALKSFYQWLTTMQPLIPTDWESSREFSSLMAEGLGIDNFWHGRNADQITPEFAEQVISDEDNPYRLAFAATLLRWIEVRECPNKHPDKYISRYNEHNRYIGHDEIKGAPFTEEETAAWYVKENKRIKAAYNRYMNKLLGLFKEVTV